MASWTAYIRARNIRAQEVSVRPYEGDPDATPYLLWFQPVITVMADNEAKARERVYRELSKNPSRMGYRDRWTEDGEIVRERYAGKQTTAASEGEWDKILGVGE